MEVLYTCCCGIDVHAKMLVACLIKNGHKEMRTFSTMTADAARACSIGSPLKVVHMWPLNRRACIGVRSSTFSKVHWK